MWHLLDMDARTSIRGGTLLSGAAALRELSERIDGRAWGARSASLRRFRAYAGITELKAARAKGLKSPGRDRSRPGTAWQASTTRYVSGIACLTFAGGKICHLAAVIDLRSRRLAGWAITGRTAYLAGHRRPDGGPRGPAAAPPGRSCTPPTEPSARTGARRSLPHAGSPRAGPDASCCRPGPHET